MDDLPLRFVRAHGFRISPFKITCITIESEDSIGAWRHLRVFQCPIRAGCNLTNLSGGIRKREEKNKSCLTLARFHSDNAAFNLGKVVPKDNLDRWGSADTDDERLLK